MTPRWDSVWMDGAKQSSTVYRSQNGVRSPASPMSLIHQWLAGGKTSRFGEQRPPWLHHSASAFRGHSRGSVSASCRTRRTRVRTGSSKSWWSETELVERWDDHHRETWGVNLHGERKTEKKRGALVRITPGLFTRALRRLPRVHGNRRDESCLGYRG